MAECTWGSLMDWHCGYCMADDWYQWLGCHGLWLAWLTTGLAINFWPELWLAGLVMVNNGWRGSGWIGNVWLDNQKHRLSGPGSRWPPCQWLWFGNNFGLAVALAWQWIWLGNIFGMVMALAVAGWQNDDFYLARLAANLWLVLERWFCYFFDVRLDNDACYTRVFILFLFLLQKPG